MAARHPHRACANGGTTPSPMLAVDVHCSVAKSSTSHDRSGAPPSPIPPQTITSARALPLASPNTAAAAAATPSSADGVVTNTAAKSARPTAIEGSDSHLANNAAIIYYFLLEQNISIYPQKFSLWTKINTAVNRPHRAPMGCMHKCGHQLHPECLTSPLL